MSFLFLCFILIVSLIFVISNPDLSRNSTIFIMSSVSSFEIIIVAIRDLWIFLIAASVADIAADNPYGNETLLARGISTSLMVNQ